MLSVPVARIVAADFTRGETSASLQAPPSTSFAAHQKDCTWLIVRKLTLQTCRAQSEGPAPLGRRERDQQRLVPKFDEAPSDEVNAFLDLRQETAFRTELRNHYELLFLIHEDNFEEVPVIIDKVKGFVGDNRGIIWRLNDWGIRPLAYKIKKASKANYVLMNIEVGFNKINELSRLLETDERVIRHMIIKRKEAITKDCEPPPNWETSRSKDLDSDEDLDEEDEEEEEQEEQAVLRA